MSSSLKREILKTLDGSTTIYLPDWDECYHSKHGAIQEAFHVFIKNGLELFTQQKLSILEIGFGTGLNAFITFLEAKKNNLNINYVGVEAYPVELSEALQMNYLTELNAEKLGDYFIKMHESNWNIQEQLTANFALTKLKQYFHEIDFENAFDLIYFDAFGFRIQPELWSTEIFKKMYDALAESGVLVTYAARGVVKRSMQEVGFIVKKVPGPPGKREMMIAFKNFNTLL